MGTQPVSPVAVARSDVSYVRFSSAFGKGRLALVSDVILILRFCKLGAWEMSCSGTSCGGIWLPGKLSTDCEGPEAV